jgi:hypothetical protein
MRKKLSPPSEYVVITSILLLFGGLMFNAGKQYAENAHGRLLPQGQEKTSDPARNLGSNYILLA